MNVEFEWTALVQHKSCDRFSSLQDAGRGGRGGCGRGGRGRGRGHNWVEYHMPPSNVRELAQTAEPQAGGDCKAEGAPKMDVLVEGDENAGALLGLGGYASSSDEEGEMRGAAKQVQEICSRLATSSVEKLLTKGLFFRFLACVCCSLPASQQESDDASEGTLLSAHSAGCFCFRCRNLRSQLSALQLFRCLVRMTSLHSKCRQSKPSLTPRLLGRQLPTLHQEQKDRTEMQ